MSIPSVLVKNTQPNFGQLALAMLFRVLLQKDKH